jgi:hypothetical protein
LGDRISEFVPCAKKGQKSKGELGGREILHFAQNDGIDFFGNLLKNEPQSSTCFGLPISVTRH